MLVEKIERLEEARRKRRVEPSGDPLALDMREFARRSGEAIVGAGGASRTPRGGVYKHRVDVRVPMKLHDPESDEDKVLMVRIRVTVEI